MRRISRHFLYAILVFPLVASSCQALDEAENLEQAGKRKRPFPMSRLRVMTYNVQMTVDPADSASMFQDMSGKQISHSQKASHIANDILEIGDIDVVVFNEVFDADAQEMFVDKLNKAYPHYVQYLDAGGVDLDSDSGLMLFSKHPFTDLDENDYIAEDVIANNGSGIDSDGDPVTPWKGVGHVDFDSVCLLPDCWGNKGAGLVQIEHSTGERFAVAFTHLQADYGDWDADRLMEARNTRRKQLELIEKMIRSTLWDGTLSSNRLFLTGDLNIDGNPHRDTTEYDDIFFGGYDFFSCAGASQCPGTGSSSSNVFKDSWKWDTIKTDIGRTNGSELIFEHDPVNKLREGKRLDYILRTKPWTESEFGEMCTQHMMIPWKVAGESSDRSDHLPVLIDTNFEAPFCNPRSPRVVSFGANFSGPATKHYSGNDIQITHPGSMQWFKVSQAGAYSFRTVGDPKVDFDVYHNTDLSRPIDDYYGVETDFGLKYDLPNPPYYIRVFNTDAAATGSYSFAAHQHRCNSPEDTCPLRPAVAFDYPWPNAPLNGDNIAYFDFHTEVADSGEFPKLDFALSGLASNDYELSLLEGVSPYSQLTISAQDSWVAYESGSASIEATPIPLNAPSGPERYIVAVKRTGIVAETTTLRFTTNLTFLFPKKLACHVRNDSYPDQTDEIFEFFDADGAGFSTLMPEDAPFVPYEKVGDFDHGTSSVTSFVNKVGVIRYLKHVVPNLTDEDDGANGENDYLRLRPEGHLEQVDIGAGLFQLRIHGLERDRAPVSNTSIIWEDEAGEDPDYRYKMEFALRHERLK